MTTLAKNAYHLRSNEAAAADDHDFDNFVFRFRCFVIHNDCSVVALWLSAKRLSIANEEVEIPRVRLSYSCCFSSFRSIRGSGINQSKAPNTYNAPAIHEFTKANGMATR